MGANKLGITTTSITIQFFEKQSRKKKDHLLSVEKHLEEIDNLDGFTCIKILISYLNY